MSTNEVMCIFSCETNLAESSCCNEINGICAYVYHACVRSKLWRLPLSKLLRRHVSCSAVFCTVLSCHRTHQWSRRHREAAHRAVCRRRLHAAAKHDSCVLKWKHCLMSQLRLLTFLI